MRSSHRVAQLLTAFAAVGLVALAGSGPAGASGGRTPVCGSSGRHLVVARDVQAEVYRVHKGESEVYEYWGCVYGRRRSVRLGVEAVSCSPYGCVGVSHVTLAGTTVAYETLSLSSPGGVNESPSSEESYKSARYVVVVDLQTGHVLHRVPTGMSRYPGLRIIGAGETRAIVVKSDGAVGWINDTFQKENRFEMHALDATGERVLAVGSNIAAESLALAGSTLYWTQGGKPKSATLN